MASSSIQSLLREVELTVKDIKSGKTARQQFVEFTRAQIADAKATNQQAVGREVPYRVAVDGKIGAPMEAVKEGGSIAAHFELLGGMLEWIGEMLVKGSPVLTGEYADSHVLFLDGVEHEPGALLPDFEEAVFVNVQPYARKLEHGLSNQAPDGVYQAVAAVAKQRYGNLASIKFTYRGIVGGTAVNQSRAASSGQPWWLGGSAPRAASGVTESQIAKVFGKTAHNKSNVRFPALIVVPR